MDRSIVYVDKAEDESGVRMYSRIGKAVIPYCSAVGKAILANLDAAGRDAVLDGVTWERHTEHTITTASSSTVSSPLVAERGWAVDDREFEPFVNCIAVPIREPAGRRRRDLGHARCAWSPTSNACRPTFPPCARRPTPSPTRLG